MKDSILAGIVLYNSDYQRLLECLERLTKQVDKIILWDNSPVEYSNSQKDDISKYKNCEYVYSEKNLGMPEAMNKIMELADEQGYTWVLTMNADSLVPDNMIQEYSQLFDDKAVGMICPQVYDRRRKYMTLNASNGYEEVDMCITSAACTRVEAWKQVGKFDSWLFVDLLDNDISKRMILNGWKIIKVNSIILDQEFGDIKPKSPNVEKFWVGLSKALHNQNIGKFSYKKIVHDNRIYYTCRNIIYLNKKFVNYGGIGYKHNYHCNTFVGFVFCFVIPSVLRSDHKIQTAKAASKGFKDGRKVKVNPWKANKMVIA